MQERTTVPNTLFHLTSAAAAVSAGLTLILVLVSAGGLWMFSSVTGILSVISLHRQLKRRRQQHTARQQLVQTYLERLQQAQTAEDRQSIVEEMAEQQLLKGIRLSSTDLEDLDLSFADFSKADLSGATLSGANLTGANLTGATLSYATLTYTTLHGATMTGANLRGVNLHGADLRQADLTDAVMRGAQLTDTTLYGAVLRHTQLHSANLFDADMRDIKLQDAVMTQATLPNGMKWEDCTDIARFTDPNHVDFWQADRLGWFVNSPRRLG